MPAQVGYTNLVFEVKQLYELQAMDLKAAAAEAGLASVRSKLSDRSDIETARRRLGELEKRNEELSTQRRALERLVAESETAVERLDRRIYGGGVTNPQQFSAAEEERRFTIARQRETEDQLLEIMIDMEELELVMVGARETKSSLEEERPGLEEGWRREERELTEELAMLRASREGLLPAMPANLLPLYESLRKSKSGLAVARVEGGTCAGCRLALTTQEMQRARMGQHVVQCSSCGRILYLA